MNTPANTARVLAVLILAGVAVLLHGCLEAMTAQMSAGERLYRRKCSSCHRLFRPEERTEPEWFEVLADHGPKINNEQRSVILTYLTDSEPAGESTDSRRFSEP